MFLVGIRIELTTKWTVTDPSPSHVSVCGIVASDYLKTCRCIGLLVPRAKQRVQGKNLSPWSTGHWVCSGRVLRQIRSLLIHS